MHHKKHMVGRTLQRIERCDTEGAVRPVNMDAADNDNLASILAISIALQEHLGCGAVGILDRIDKIHCREIVFRPGSGLQQLDYCGIVLEGDQTRVGLAFQHRQPEPGDQGLGHDFIQPLRRDALPVGQTCGIGACIGRIEQLCLQIAGTDAFIEKQILHRWDVQDFVGTDQRVRRRGLWPRAFARVKELIWKLCLGHCFPRSLGRGGQRLSTI